MNHADSGAVDWAFVAAVLDQAEKGEVVLDSEIARICRALLAALDDLDAVKAERDKWHDLAAANGRAALDELAQVVAAEARAEAAEAANAALTARCEALERERDAARNAALGEAIEAMSNKVANWSEDEDLHDWIAPGKTMIAEVAAIHANAGEG